VAGGRGGHVTGRDREGQRGNIEDLLGGGDGHPAGPYGLHELLGALLTAAHRRSGCTLHDITNSIAGNMMDKVI
jgi:hypothetical protein